MQITQIVLKSGAGTAHVTSTKNQLIPQDILEKLLLIFRYNTVQISVAVCIFVDKWLISLIGILSFEFWLILTSTNSAFQKISGHNDFDPIFPNASSDWVFWERVFISSPFILS